MDKNKYGRLVPPGVSDSKRTRSNACGTGTSSASCKTSEKSWTSTTWGARTCRHLSVRPPGLRETLIVLGSFEEVAVYRGERRHASYRRSNTYGRAHWRHIRGRCAQMKKRLLSSPALKCEKWLPGNATSLERSPKTRGTRRGLGHD